MTTARQTITNDKDSPIYVSVEPWPECFELEPGDKVTLVYEVPDYGDALLVSFHNERELIVWPQGNLDEFEILINGGSSAGRSWKFKHK